MQFFKATSYFVSIFNVIGKVETSKYSIWNNFELEKSFFCGDILSNKILAIENAKSATELPFQILFHLPG